MGALWEHWQGQSGLRTNRKFIAYRAHAASPQRFSFEEEVGGEITWVE